MLIWGGGSGRRGGGMSCRLALALSSRFGDDGGIGETGGELR